MVNPSEFKKLLVDIENEVKHMAALKNDALLSLDSHELDEHISRLNTFGNKINKLNQEGYAVPSQDVHNQMQRLLKDITSLRNPTISQFLGHLQRRFSHALERLEKGVSGIDRRKVVGTEMEKL